MAEGTIVDEPSRPARSGLARLVPARTGRFGLPFVLVAVWLVMLLLLPSHPLPSRSTAGLGGSTGPSTPSGLVPSVAPGAAAGPAATVPTGGSTPTTAPATGGSSGPATSGVSRGGVTCGAGVHQVPGDSYAAPCVPAFTGSNGGATARGVTATTIRVVFRSFPESANSQAVNAVVAQAGGADQKTVRAVREKLIEEFERTYELYGRHVQWIDYVSRYGDETQETEGKGREGACLDAEVVANELHAFAVIGDKGAVSKPFTECAAQRGVVVLDGASYASEKFYADRNPYVWAVIMDCERINYQVAEYLAKRLDKRPARWAGDAALAKQTRKFGVYTPVGDGEDNTCSKISSAQAARYGYDESSHYEYVLDVSRFPDEAARGAIQLKRDGVTTVVMAADPISMIFLTQSATAQGWHPEWFLIGIILTDVDNAARLYDQTQVNGHLFGMSQLGATSKLLGPLGEPGKLYQKLTGQQIPPGTDGQFYEMTHSYNLLQAAGPILTPQNMAAGAFALPPSGGPDFAAGYWSFQDGPDGTPGAHDHTEVDDSREVYWRGDVRSPNDGKAGTYLETYGGRRFRNGEWPAEEPPVYPERR